MNPPSPISLRRRIAATLAGAIFLFLLVAPAAQAEVRTFDLNAFGSNEVSPTVGDPDGFAIGTLTLNNGTGGNTGSMTISLTMTNIDLSDLRGHHIHSGPAGANGPIVLDFGDPDLLLSGNMLSGTITGLSSTVINNVFANPTQFYYNLHNGAHTGGAVRSQLPIPEPGTTALLVLGAGGGLLMAWRRRTSRSA